MLAPNFTNDPERESWVAAANSNDSDFPIQNLPFGVFRERDTSMSFRGGVAIGEQIVDLRRLAASNLLAGAAQQAAEACSQPVLNEFLALGPAALEALRASLFELLLEGSPFQARISRCLLAQRDAEHAVPVSIGDYTDFYSSIHHAKAVGRLFRPDNPLLPNYRWVPIGYHGRASSILVSGHDFQRPRGQLKEPADAAPSLGPSRRMDYELELGMVIGRGNPLGRSIEIGQAESHVFGVNLLNDWSARDIQAWEYQPLGPFLGKSFATTISPWIVTLQALAPFRVAPARQPDDPNPLPYLSCAENKRRGAIDIRLEVSLSSRRRRDRGESPVRLTTTNYRHAYWTMAQLIAHHTVNGCNLRAGDLLGTGTQSGPDPEEAGSLLELTRNGAHPLSLGDGETRSFLEDGDTVILRAHCTAPGRRRIGFGEASATITAAAREA